MQDKESNFSKIFLDLKFLKRARLNVPQCSNNQYF